MPTLAERIIARRQELGLSRYVVAGLTGMTKSNLGYIERGITLDPRVSHVVALARVLHTTPNILLGFVEEEPNA